jgi:ATP-dependent helicase HepA
MTIASSHCDSNQSLLAGMYVRIPLDRERTDYEFRDFGIGRIAGFDQIANTVTVSLQTYDPDEPPKEVPIECPRGFVYRCHILPATQFTHAPTGQAGQVLIACSDEWVDGQFCDYYVQIEGQVIRVSEADIIVASHRQSPHPYHQLSRYEFQHPIWKSHRDDLIESYAELRAATFGIEDLVGSRIMLLSHQAEVVTKVLGDETCRYILADEVGLGKTIEACVILKGLYRRHPGLKTLIVTPASLTRQWYYEFDKKFWLNFATHVDDFLSDEDSPGLIISAEELATDEKLWWMLGMQEWGLFIADEAHHIRKRAQLYQRICQLSGDARRALIISATPIQRRAEEYLSLLKIMNPARYGAIDTRTFQDILATQQTTRKTIAYLSQAMTPDEFDPEEFVEEMGDVLEELSHDRILPKLIEQVSTQSTISQDRGLGAARETLAYVCENYRIESRVIRNRRVSLNIDLPKREIDVTCSYNPDQVEEDALEELHDYVDYTLTHIDDDLLTPEYCRVLLHAAFSSPHILIELLTQRLACLSNRVSQDCDEPEADLSSLVSPAEPRREAERIKRLMSAIPSAPNELAYLDRLIRLSQRWLEQTEDVLRNLPFLALAPDKSHRLVQVLRAVQQLLFDMPDAKVVIFSTWHRTLTVLLSQLKKLSTVAQFHCGIEPDRLQDEADKFQADQDCKIILCDELGGEGRNFQIADLIIHVDLPWTPAQLEQRIGRVDRLGRQGTVLSVVPFARNTIEQDLFQIWYEAFHLFTQSMSGLEIVLEGIQDELLAALARSSRNGLAQLLPEMIAKAETLQAEVEEERYFEEGAINYRRRKEFNDMSEKYRDGTRLGRSILRWASLAGLENEYDPQTSLVHFYPRQFNLKSMQNAKFFDPPNMEEALIRSGRIRHLVINGTFNRDIAVRREDLVFYAPGEPWTDKIIRNAVEADRGRCCAILRAVTELDQSWQGFELFYTLQINPRPLYEAGFEPVHLLRAQGYLFTSTYHLVISIDGEILKPSDLVCKVIRGYPRKTGDVHLGKRDAPSAHIQVFREAYPVDMWHSVLEHVFSVAEHALEEEFSFTVDLAEEASQQFKRNASGLRAAQYRLFSNQGLPPSIDSVCIEEYEQISAALIEGIQRPLWQLESACFWILKPDRE